MKRRMGIWLVMVAGMLVLGHAVVPHHHHHHEGHAHDEVLQLTAYSDRFEVYAEAEPFVAGTESEIVAHFTFLDSFKPLEAGTVVASLVSKGEVLAQDTLTAPTKQGIYKLHLTPSREGQGAVLFRVLTNDREDVLRSPAVTIYTDAHEAQHAAADLKATSSNGVVFTKEASWKAAFATDSCRLQPMGSVIRTMAQVLPAQGDERMVTAQAAGIVTIAANMSAGASVTSGQTLLTIESGGLYPSGKEETPKKQTRAKMREMLTKRGWPTRSCGT